jgi:hypothetical protein
MKVEYFNEAKLSETAEELVYFDVDSIRQVVAANHARQPETWLADGESYEKNGRILRDSGSPRLLAYSRLDRIVYATDGCNSCTRRLSGALEVLTDQELETLARENELRLDLLDRLRTLSTRHLA